MAISRRDVGAGEGLPEEEARPSAQGLRRQPVGLSVEGRGEATRCVYTEIPQPALASPSLLTLQTSQASLAAMTQGRVHSLSATGQPHNPDPSLSLPSSCSTKQMLADIMQFQPGDSLEEILSLPVSREQVSGQVAHQSSVCIPPAYQHCPFLPLAPPTAHHKQTAVLTGNSPGAPPAFLSSAPCPPAPATSVSSAGTQPGTTVLGTAGGRAAVCAAAVESAGGLAPAGEQSGRPGGRRK